MMTLTGLLTGLVMLVHVPHHPPATDRWAHVLKEEPDISLEETLPKGQITPVGMGCANLETLRKIVRLAQSSGTLSNFTDECDAISLEPEDVPYLRPLEGYPLVENIPGVLSDMLIFEVVTHGRVAGCVAVARIAAWGNAI